MTDENVERAWGEAVRRLLAPAPGSEPLVAGRRRAEQDGATASRPAGNGWRRRAPGGTTSCWPLGGGVVGDLAGFAAATYQRGVGLWQVPTSLLAQVDSSVGGKTAIDLTAGKNLVGAFYQPGLVVIDPRDAEHLARGGVRERSGRGGQVRASGRGDALRARWSEERQRIVERDPGVLSDMIKTCVRYKAAVVAEDELDTGRRAVLNLGHTTAHALEVSLGYGRLRHGEAVGLGLLVALAVSEKAAGTGSGGAAADQGAAGAIWACPWPSRCRTADVLLAAAAKDKKVTAGSAGFVGLRALGEPGVEAGPSRRAVRRKPWR